MRKFAGSFLVAVVVALMLVAAPADAARKHHHRHHHKAHHAKVTKAELRQVRRLAIKVRVTKVKVPAVYPGDPGQIAAPVGAPKVPVLPGANHCQFYVPVVVNGVHYVTCG